MKTARKLVAVCALVAAYAVGVRPALLRGSATEEEVARPYPGADLVPGGKRGATMAVTINAPPSRLWPWLVQMGCDRAGWYSWDRLDNAGTPSAERIHPQWQQIAVGDHLVSSPSGNTWFEVAAVEYRVCMWTSSVGAASASELVRAVVSAWWALPPCPA